MLFTLNVPFYSKFKKKGYYEIHLTQQVVSNISQSSALPPMCCKNFEPIVPQGFNKKRLLSN